jgi:hypothetical protein
MEQCPLLQKVKQLKRIVVGENLCSDVVARPDPTSLQRFLSISTTFGFNHFNPELCPAINECIGSDPVVPVSQLTTLNIEDV